MILQDKKVNYNTEKKMETDGSFVEKITNKEDRGFTVAELAEVLNDLVKKSCGDYECRYEVCCPLGALTVYHDGEGVNFG